MQVRIFTLRFNPATDGFDDAVVTSFLADKELLAMDNHFFLKDGIPYLTLVVSYRTTALPSIPETLRPEQKRDESWRESLTEADWPLFNTLRTWRSETAKREGIPPYVIANNRQLAEVAKVRPQTLAALGGIDGFGEAKLAKHGKDLLALVAGGGESGDAEN